MLHTPTEGARTRVDGGRTTALKIWSHLRRWARWVYWRTLLAIGVTRLLLGVALGRVRELWIGDSHAVLLNSPRFPFPVLAPVREGQYAWHVGPLLLHSVGVRGFPLPEERVARLNRRLPASRRLSCVIVYGEIDVRCHLAPRLDGGLDPAFVARYVDRTRRLRDAIGAPRAVIVVPTPPSDDVQDHVMFPVAGNLAQRIEAHSWVRTTLIDTLGDRRDPRLHLLDLREVLADTDGRLRSELTFDGCHTNDAGRAVVRAHFLSQLEAAW
jgi:hypothetical protein